MRRAVLTSLILSVAALMGCAEISSGVTDEPKLTSATMLTETTTQTTAATTPETTVATTAKPDLELISASLSSVSERISTDFLEWCDKRHEGIAVKLSDISASDERSLSNVFYELCGESLYVLSDAYTGASDGEAYFLREDKDGVISISVGGDFSLADNWHMMQYLETTENGIDDCLSQKLIYKLVSSDISMLNNEFAFSDRGTPMPGKQFTFVGKTENVSIYQRLGIDIVSLANNHCFDYGADAFADTMQTLSDADIAYIGGGANLEEACRPTYCIIAGRKIAFVAATRAEKYVLTPAASDSTGGVLRAYDPKLFCEVINKASLESDYVISYIHWGTEGSNALESVQPETARLYIESGTDILIGAHAHCLQGIEFVDDVPVFYNLGNFWFNGFDIDTVLLEIALDADNLTASCSLTPCLQRGCRTVSVDGTDEGLRILKFVEDISINAAIGEDGSVTRK